MSNKLLIAAAGAGKTTFIISEAMKQSNSNVLITTFTQANENAIREKMIKQYGCIPAGITIQTWFSFLIEHGVKPFQFWDKRVMGMQLVSTQSALRYRTQSKNPVYWSESDTDKHYFNNEMDVYSDKLSKLVIRCNENSSGAVIERLQKIYNYLFVDEIQDMAGYDLELLKIFLQSDITLIMVGDPRQTVYLTHHERKYSKYADGKIRDFIENECKKVVCKIDDITLNVSHRNVASICDFSSQLFPDYVPCKSLTARCNKHNGLFFVKKRDVQAYYRLYHPMQLRYDKKTKLMISSIDGLNFGESKGIEFDHVLIYPTKNMLAWIIDHKTDLSATTRAKLYVAITRSRYSVAIMVDDNFNQICADISIWKE